MRIVQNKKCGGYYAIIAVKGVGPGQQLTVRELGKVCLVYMGASAEQTQLLPVLNKAQR